MTKKKSDHVIRVNLEGEWPIASKYPLAWRALCLMMEKDLEGMPTGRSVKWTQEIIDLIMELNNHLSCCQSIENVIDDCDDPSASHAMWPRLQEVRKASDFKGASIAGVDFLAQGIPVPQDVAHTEPTAEEPALSEDEAAKRDALAMWTDTFAGHMARRASGSVVPMPDEVLDYFCDRIQRGGMPEECIEAWKLLDTDDLMKIYHCVRKVLQADTDKATISEYMELLAH